MSMSATAVPTLAPTTALPTAQADIVGYAAEDEAGAGFGDAFGTPPPLLVTLTPVPSKRKGLSALEMLLVAFAIAVGVMTLCMLVTASKK